MTRLITAFGIGLVKSPIRSSTSPGRLRSGAAKRSTTSRICASMRRTARGVSAPLNSRRKRACASGPCRAKLLSWNQRSMRALGLRLEVLPRAAVLGGVLGIVEEPLHVVVARHEPEAERGHEVDGILGAQPVHERRRVLRREQLEEEVRGRRTHPWRSSLLAIIRLLVYYWIRCQPRPTATSAAARRPPTASSRRPRALFGERGVEATKVADICARADVAHQTFFNHFPTKQDLVREIARIGRDFFVAAIETATGEGASTGERLARLFASIHEAAATAGPMHQDLVSETMREAQAVREGPRRAGDPPRHREARAQGPRARAT